MALHIGWLTAFIDRPAQSFDAAEAFWLAVTGSSLSPRRGPTGQFATLLPSDGDAYLRVQRMDRGPGGCHLDIHVADLGTSAATAVEFGATVSEIDGVTVARSPAGMTFCIVGHRAESTRPRPVGTPGTRALVDQLSIDVPPAWFGRECEFWAALTGGELTASRARPEFAVLARQVGLPLRLLLQRLDDAAADQAAGAHLDLACDDPDTTAERHVALGATVIETHRFWTVMADPTGLPYCLTRRSPDTGVLDLGG